MSFGLHNNIRMNIVCICICTSDGVRLRIIANLHVILICIMANIFIRVCISKHGCTSIGTHLCINALVVKRV